MKANPFLIFIFLCSSLTHGELYRDFEKRIYEDNKWKVDRSAASICYVVDGTLEEVKPGKPEYGYTCEMELKAYSANDKDAEDMCSSTFPHYILEAKPKDQNTRCKFIILNKCLDNYYLIYEKCYLVLGKPVPYAKAKELCETKQGNKPEPKLAEYTSSNLGVDLLHMDFLDVWMQVPERSEHFAGVEEEGGAVFVIRNSWQYETKEGTLEMDDLGAEHQPMCEYTPKMMQAGINFRIGKYNVPGFPAVIAVGSGFSFNASEYCPERSTDCKEAYGNGLAAIFETEAPKFSSPRTIPPPKSLDADLGPCPKDWLRYERSNGQVICHGLYHYDGNKLGETMCHEHAAHLSAFNSEEEIDAVLRHFKVKDRPNYWISLGGVAPCALPACYDTPKKKRTDLDFARGPDSRIWYTHQWTNGLATNLDVMYDHMYNTKLDRFNRNRMEIAMRVNGRYFSGAHYDFVIVGYEVYYDYMCGKFADY